MDSRTIRRTGTYTALFCSLPLIICGCGGGSRNLLPRPISVYLPISDVQLAAGAKPVTIPILIESDAETAQVAVAGLPAGVQFTYASSDTNPSGSLTFSAISSAMIGSYKPTVIVTSAGSSASATLTIDVQSP